MGQLENSDSDARSLIAIGGEPQQMFGGFLYLSFVAVALISLQCLPPYLGWLMLPHSSLGEDQVSAPVGKNLVGAFHSPRRVVVDLDRQRKL